jgi:hypothetical protein
LVVRRELLALVRASAPLMRRSPSMVGPFFLLLATAARRPSLTDRQQSQQLVEIDGATVEL